jgi:hypothetical protein
MLKKFEDFLLRLTLLSKEMSELVSNKPLSSFWLKKNYLDYHIGTEMMKVFDLDKQEWRSFLQTSITRIEFDLK